LIAIIDYGMGNLHSVSKAIERLGFSVVVTSDPSEIIRADGAILPGVGAFGDAMVNLRDTGLDRTTVEYAGSGKPLLGICLGMQLLFEQSEEHGKHEGLGLLPGEVVRFSGDFKVPHMGWNELEYHRSSPLLAGLGAGERSGADAATVAGAAKMANAAGAGAGAGIGADYVYFVHSYRVLPGRVEDLIATTDYYGSVSAIVGRDNVYGMQFHPEKSGNVGMRLLGNFLGLCK
jgi:imidazole glycerol-phosphate synthase subunit HisH